MNKNDIKVGQIWKSTSSYNYVGYYTVKILEIHEDTITTKFTASEWEDKHWEVESAMKISSLLNGYYLT